MRLVWVPPVCKGCGGEGCVRNEGLVPRTCEVCEGAGYKVNPIVTVGALVLIVVTTVGPVLWAMK